MVPTPLRLGTLGTQINSRRCHLGTGSAFGRAVRRRRGEPGDRRRSDRGCPRYTCDGLFVRHCRHRPGEALESFPRPTSPFRRRWWRTAGPLRRTEPGSLTTSCAEGNCPSIGPGPLSSTATTACLPPGLGTGRRRGWLRISRRLPQRRRQQSSLCRAGRNTKIIRLRVGSSSTSHGNDPGGAMNDQGHLRSTFA